MPKFLAEKEVIGVFLRCIFVFHLRHHPRDDGGLAPEHLTHALSAALTLADYLGDDISCTSQRGLHIRDSLFYKALSHLPRISLALRQDSLRQRLQTQLTRHLRPCAPTWFIGHIDIFYLRGVPTAHYTLAQLIGELALLFYGLEHGVLSFLQFPESLAQVADGGHLHLV